MKAQRGSYRYSSTLSLTLALDWGGWSTPRTGRFIPGKDLEPIVQEAEWASELVWTGDKTHPPPEFNPQTIQPIASPYTDYAIPASGVNWTTCNFTLKTDAVNSS